MTSEELGKLAEEKLKELALQGSLVSNPVDRDVSGFDSILELKIDSAARAHDLAPPPVRFFVQVKGTQRTNGSVPIKLSNWQRMISDPNPWFVFVCRADDDKQVSEAFLVHIDQHWIEKALRRLRECTVQRTQLHKVKLSVTCTPQDRLPRVHGSALRTRLLESIGADPEKYCKQKRRFYEECGYSKVTHEIEVSFPEKPTEQHILEWSRVALGYQTDLDVKHARMTDLRFDLPVVVEDGEVSKVSWAPRGTRGYLQVHGSDSSEVFGLPAQIFSTASNPGIPAKYAKMRIKAGPLSFEFSTAPLETKEDHAGGHAVDIPATFKWDDESECELSTMALAARTLRELHRGRTTLTLQYNNANPTSSFTFHVGDLPPLSQEMEDGLREIEAAAFIIKSAGIAELEVSPGEIVRGYPRFRLLSTLAGKPAGDLSVAVRASPPDKAGECALVIIAVARAKDWLFFACGAIQSLPELSAAAMNFKPGRVRFCGLWPVRRTDVGHFSLEDKVREFVEELDKDPDILCVYHPDQQVLEPRAYVRAPNQDVQRGQG